MIIISKLFRKLRSFLTIFKFKMIYGSKFQCSWSAMLTPSLTVRINERGGVKIGRKCSFREHVCINITDGSIVIEEGCFFNDFVCLNARESITIGPYSIFGQGVKIYDHDHDFRSTNVHDNFRCKPVTINENVWVGSNAVILRGATIGRNSVIGANSIFKNKLDEYTLYYNKISPYIERISVNHEEKIAQKNYH